VLAKPKELKFFLTRPNELVREDERSSSPTQALATGEDERSSSPKESC